MTKSLLTQQLWRSFTFFAKIKEKVSVVDSPKQSAEENVGQEDKSRRTGIKIIYIVKIPKKAWQFLCNKRIQKRPSFLRWFTIRLKCETWKVASMTWKHLLRRFSPSKSNQTTMIINVPKSQTVLKNKKLFLSHKTV